MYNNFNLQAFVLEALKKLKTYFHCGDIYTADKMLRNKEYKDNLNLYRNI